MEHQYAARLLAHAHNCILLLKLPLRLVRAQLQMATHDDLRSPGRGYSMRAQVNQPFS